MTDDVGHIMTDRVAHAMITQAVLYECRDKVHPRGFRSVSILEVLFDRWKYLALLDSIRTPRLTSLVLGYGYGSFRIITKPFSCGKDMHCASSCVLSVQLGCRYLKEALFPVGRSRLRHIPYPSYR